MMTPWDAPIVITRAWCLWEIFCTLKAEPSGCRFTLGLSPTEEDSLLVALAASGVEAMLQPFADIDCRRAEATNPDDLSKIQDAIRTGAHLWQTGPSCTHGDSLVQYLWNVHVPQVLAMIHSMRPC